MLQSKKKFNQLIKNYSISKFQNFKIINQKKFSNIELFLTAGSQTDFFMKDLVAYNILMFGRKPFFSYKRQSKQNLLNQTIYSKITLNNNAFLNNIEKISQFVIPNQENYLPQLIKVKSNQKNTQVITFNSCLTNEELSFLPKTNNSKILNNFNLIINLNATNFSHFEILFFLRFYHFPLK